MFRTATRFFFIFFISLILVSNSFSQWVETFGFNFDDRALALATDDLGNIYVTGYVTSGTGNVDFCTIKYNSEGKQVWQSPATYNGPGNGEDRAFGIVVDSDRNVIVTGYSTGQGSLSDWTTIKYRGTDGQQLWIYRLPTPANGEDRAFGIAVDRLDDVYVTGYISQIGTGNDVFTIKHRGTDGEVVWSDVIENLNISSEDRAFGIVVDSASENIYLCGYLQDDTTGFDFMVASYDSTGNERWVRRYNGPGNNNDRAFGIAVDNSNNIYATGIATFDTASRTDYATIKYNSDGDTSWVRRYNGPGNNNDRSFGIVVDNAGNSYITGYSMNSNSNTDYVTIKYNSSGTSSWTKNYDGIGNNQDTAYGIYISKNYTQVYVTGGSANDTGAGKLDAVTVKYDAITGTQLEFDVYDGEDHKNDVAVAITADTSKNLFIAGYTQTLTNGDNWITKRFPLGNLIKVNMISTQVPQNFKLYQNYPNPFNPSTIIKFDVQKTAFVKLKIYDILGRVVVVLVNQYLKVGSYEAMFSTPSLASGLYFYELTAEDYKDTKKMILIK